VATNRFRQHRTRLLVISKDDTLRNNLVTLLTGYGYFVDYVENRHDGLRKFRENKHAIAIVDVHTLPRLPERFFKAFRIFKRNPIIIIAATEEEMPRVYPYLCREVYDILQLPFKMEYLDFVFKRLVDHHFIMKSNEFLKTLFLMLCLIAPIWLALFYVMIRLWGK
jgi:DNA-binding NtrC family response regulator